MTIKTLGLYFGTQYLEQLNLCSQARITEVGSVINCFLLSSRWELWFYITTPTAYRSGSTFRRTGTENYSDRIGTPKKQSWECPCRRPGKSERVMVPCSLLSLSLAWKFWGPSGKRVKRPRDLWLCQLDWPYHSLSNFPQSLPYIFRLALWQDPPPRDHLSFFIALW